MLGSDLPDPMMYMFFLPITAIPDYAITDVGPVDYLALTTFDPVLEVNENKIQGGHWYEERRIKNRSIQQREESCRHGDEELSGSECFFRKERAISLFAE